MCLPLLIQTSFKATILFRDKWNFNSIKKYIKQNIVRSKEIIFKLDWYKNLFVYLV